MKRQIKRWMKIFKAAPAKVPAARDLGDAARDKSDWASAAGFYRTHLETTPQDFAIWVQLGHSLKELRQYEQAAAAYASAAAIHGDDTDLLLNQGHLAKLRKNYTEATHFYRLSLAIDPSGPAASEIEALDMQAAAEASSRVVERPRIESAAPKSHVPAKLTARVEDFSLYALSDQKLLSCGQTPLGTVAPGAPQLQDALGMIADMRRLAPGLASLALRLGSNILNDLPDAVRTWAPYDLGRCGLGLEDCWFVNDASLRWRISHPDSEADTPLVVRFYQPPVAGHGALAVIGEAHILAGSIAFIDTPLSNAFLPILITVSNTHGALLATTLAPFPTLVRGGVHHAELYALGTALGDHSNLALASKDLLAEWSRSAAEAPPSLSSLVIDLQNATGAERIFTPSVVEWLTGVMGLKVSATLDRADSTLGYLATYLNEFGRVDSTVRGKTGGLVLTIPADALPTLSSMVSRRLGGASVTGSYLTADANSGRPGWAVSMPVSQDDLSSFQPRRGIQGFPILSGAVDGGGAAAVAAPPLAIRYLDPSFAHSATLLMPSAPDSDLPVLRKTMTRRDRTAATVSVLVVLRSSPSRLATFVHSVATQAGIGALELLVGMSAPDGSQARQNLDAMLDGVVPGRSVCIGAADDIGAVNALSEIATGRLLLVVDENVVLHDRRLLETLCTLMTKSDVASAGCVLLNERRTAKGSDMRFRSAGIHPSHISFRSVPALAFHEPQSLGALPGGTYPVVANASRLSLLRRSAWRALGGLNPEMVSLGDAMLDWSLRALAADNGHLCTSAVSAADVTYDAPPGLRENIGLSQVTTRRWSEVLNSSCVLRAL